MADPKPLDAFLVNARDHYFVFRLKPETEAPDRIPYAMFKMRHDEDRPILAVVITPQEGGGEVEVAEIRRPSSVIMVALTDN